MSGTVIARSASRYGGAVTAASTALISRTRSAVHWVTLHPMMYAISVESSDAAVRTSAFTSRGSVTRIPTARMDLTKQTVSRAPLNTFFSCSLYRPNYRPCCSGEVKLLSIVFHIYRIILLLLEVN